MAIRKNFPAKTKAEILKKHLQKKNPISELCESYGCAPGSVYQWQDTLFTRAHEVFDNKRGRPVDQKARAQKEAALEAKLADKNAVIAELLEELLAVKKSIGVL